MNRAGKTPPPARRFRPAYLWLLIWALLLGGPHVLPELQAGQWQPDTVTFAVIGDYGADGPALAAV
ncbi:MAG: hypothetical protein D6715_06925, partial [Calditrichaeota bacterium]